MRSIRSIPRLPRRPHTYVRHTKLPIVRDHQRRPVEFGEDELEQRAISKGMFAGATLPERIVYKQLAKLIGTDNFIFQRSEQGGRNYLGGYVLDFVLFGNLIIEVLGDYWHKAEHHYADQERALTLQTMGYDYYEIWEHDILNSDELLEGILRAIIGGRVIGTGPQRYSDRSY